MNPTPSTYNWAPAFRPGKGVPEWLIAALTGYSAQQKAQAILWAKNNLKPPQLYEFYKMAVYFRPSMRRELQLQLDALGFELQQYADQRSAQMSGYSLGGAHGNLGGGIEDAGKILGMIEKGVDIFGKGAAHAGKLFQMTQFGKLNMNALCHPAGFKRGPECDPAAIKAAREQAGRAKTAAQKSAAAVAMTAAITGQKPVDTQRQIDELTKKLEAKEKKKPKDNKNLMMLGVGLAGVAVVLLLVLRKPSK